MAASFFQRPFGGRIMKVEDTILPRMDEWEVSPRTAVATAMQAQEQGIARISMSSEQLYERARRTMGQAREATEVLMQAGLIPPPEA